MDLLFVISQENVSLAIAEIEQLFRTTCTSFDEGIVRATIEVTDAPLVRRLAFTRIASELLFNCASDKLAATCIAQKQSFSSYEGSFACDSFGKMPKGSYTKKELGSMIHPLLSHPHVDLTNPVHRFDFIFSSQPQGDQTCAVALRIYTNAEDWNSRKAHKRPVLHPSGMHPKLARALVNLSGARKEMLDPLCGTGGILIEAGLAGLEVHGSDIDPKLLADAKRNLDHYRVPTTQLEVGDAIMLHQRVRHIEAIVTDFPYGLHSRAPKDREDFYVRALLAFATVTSRAVIVLPHTTNAQVILEKTPWKLVSQFSWYAHASLTRVIYLLQLPS
jgi:putative methyltransferase (TIGR01177 family)